MTDLYENGHEHNGKTEEERVYQHEDSDEEQEDTDITTIPYGTPEEDAVDIMERYIRDAYIDEERISFYSCSPTIYHSYMDHINEMGNAWNQALENAKGEDYPSVQLILQRTGHQYTLPVEILKGTR
jgi:hypothetical protein